MHEDGLDRVARMAARSLSVGSVRITAEVGGGVYLQGAFGPHPSQAGSRVDHDLLLAGTKVGVLSVCGRDDLTWPADADDVVQDVLQSAAAEVERVALATMAMDLRDQEARLSALLSAVPFSVLIVDSVGCLVPVNVAALSLLGVHDGDVKLSDRFPGLNHNSPPFGWRRAEDRVDVARAPVTTVLRLSDDTRKAVEITLAPLDDGERMAGASGRWLMVVRDLGVDADTAVPLARQRRLTELVLDSAADGIVGMDADGIVLFANRAARQFLRCRESDLVGHRFHDIAHHTHADGSPYAWEDCPSRKAILTGTDISFTDENYVRRDHSMFPVDVLIAPIVADGEVVGAVSSFRDVSERKAMDRLQQQFIAVVSHELRTPLASIQGSLRLLDAGVMGAVTDEQKTLVRMAVDNSDRLSRLVDDILDLERLDEGRMPINPEPLEIRDLLAKAARGIAGSAAAAQVALDLTLPDEPVTVLADPHRMLQVLTNLLGNAVKFSSAGALVRLWSEVEAGTVRLVVHDDGRGIPSDQLTTVFDRFHQVEGGDARRQSGAGLGLAIAREIVVRSGGTIVAESAPGRGTSFVVGLPVATADELARLAALAQEPAYVPLEMQASS